ncbi:MAG: porin family protein [Capnocytophaga sp.]|nr:porin family protein [Capnocytophaga sp.]
MNRFLKNILLCAVAVAGITQAAAQRKDPLYNMEHFDDNRIQWGYYFGINMLDFKFDYENLDYTNPLTTEIQIKKNYGFNVGLSGDLRLMKYFNLRIEPGLVYNQRDLYFPGFQDERDYIREVRSTYVYIPVLLKISSKRWYNFKPYVTVGASTTINLSSNEKLNIDNSENKFRMKKNTYFYELGVGLDVYTPYFRFSPSIRGLFSLNDELIPDMNANSQWTGNLNRIQTRGFLINLTFE